LNLEMPIDTSNVMLYCGSCSKGTKVGLRRAQDGSKERFCRKCGAALGTVSPAKSKMAAR
jgi:large subunit ribosomal protein L24